MHSIFSRDNWQVSYGGQEPYLDFCLWILQKDGLRVPPFDQHPDGDGSLRAIGLTASDWRSWFLRTLNKEQRNQDIKQLRQQKLSEYLKISGEPDLEHLGKRYRAEKLKLSKGPPLPPIAESHFYHASWRGSDAIRDRLLELGNQYKEVSRQYDPIHADISRAMQKEERKSGVNLYDELIRYSAFLPSFTAHFVIYEYPLDYLYFPAMLILTIQEGQPEPLECRERILSAAAELAAQQGRRSKQSVSTKYIRTEDKADQLPGVYRRLARKSIPPRPAKQELPIFADSARQAVVDLLNDRPMFGSVDFATLQFSREKQRQGWRLYEVTFQETDGEQQHMLFVFQQKEDGTWQFVSGGSRADIQNIWSEMYAPVHDHPLIFLSPGWQSLDNKIYLLHIAYGDVIDNGFHVKRVRLINDAGQVLEDTVEDGFIFFGCTIEEQVQLPMRAELYDDKNKLVWQEMVTIGGGLPPWLKLK